ncbi:MAG: sigma factor-like helix-turn-helix DNA-binding protein [Thermodesulfobacteriota bacterium]
MFQQLLSPRQRAVLLLRDVFDYSVRETAAALGITEASVKTSHHRARRAMRTYDRQRCIPTRALQEQTRRALEQFLTGLANQDVAAIEALLAADVRALNDGGGEFLAALKPIVGPAKVRRFFLKLAQKNRSAIRLRLGMINGLPACVIDFAYQRPRAAPRVVLRCDVDADGRIREFHAILATRKLSAVRA